MILVDAGPLVAIVDRSDRHHRRCVVALQALPRPLTTVWPAVAEALVRVSDVPGAQEAVLELVERGAVRIAPLDDADVPRLRQLIAKYRDRPMGLADAALVRVAEREGLDTVFTIDRRDFQAYRIGRRRPFRLIPES